MIGPFDNVYINIVEVVFASGLDVEIAALGVAEGEV